MLKHKTLGTLSLLAAALLLAACNHNDEMKMARYQIEVTNLSNNQPFSPPALVAHLAGYQPWMIGSAASDGLEKLAEGGDNSAFVSEAQANPKVKAVIAGSELILPGASASFSLESAHTSDLQLSLATMLVNTNDAFTGLAGRNIGMLGSGGSLTLYGSVYDAGTEENSETAATIPGPAGGGEGYNMARESANRVSMHGGVVTMDDGLASSALNQSHRFDNPAVKIVITRQ